MLPLWGKGRLFLHFRSAFTYTNASEPDLKTNPVGCTFPYRTPENQMPQVPVVLSTEQASIEQSKA